MPKRVPAKNALSVVNIVKMDGSLRANINTIMPKMTAIPIRRIKAFFSGGIAPGRINAIMTNTEENIHKKTDR